MTVVSLPEQLFVAESDDPDSDEDDLSAQNKATVTVIREGMSFQRISGYYVRQLDC
ncbi:hypothetical protein [Nocardia salmonicida]|uniref:hypothetical protein n=1 Tax=Nocardia salmonicida TaxID=53431 RepID=UPI003CEA342F